LNSIEIEIVIEFERKTEEEAKYYALRVEAVKEEEKWRIVKNGRV